MRPIKLIEITEPNVACSAGGFRRDERVDIPPSVVQAAILN